MKKIVLISLFIFSFVNSAISQVVTSGSLNVLKGQGKVNLELDFSQASIMGTIWEKYYQIVIILLLVCFQIQDIPLK